jgi:DNA-binding XRE family transcriptional regulator
MSIILSQPERLLIHRRRLGYTQARAAKHWKLHAHIYARMENGDAVTLRRHALSVPKAAAPNLKDHERCLIMRRRCGKTQVQVAKELAVSRYWLNLMELGKVPCDDLLWFWEH